MASAEYPHQHTEILAVGQAAPDFELRAVLPGGQWESLGPRCSWDAGRSAVLVFFPMAFSPACSAQMPDFSQLQPQFAALGADVYGVSRENPYVLRSWSRLLRLKVPLVSDMALQVAGQFGVALPHYGLSRRAVFVVDPPGTVAFAFAEEDSADLTLEAQDVLTWLERRHAAVN